MSLKFFISELIITGNQKPSAKVKFEKGLNVISGPSNTGKSFILGCIDFMFGSRSAPEQIPEAIGYELVYLIIETIDYRRFTIRRNINGGPFEIKEGDFNSDKPFKEYKESLSSDDDNISTFYLSLAKLNNAIHLKENSRNSKSRLSFRNIAGLIVVDEETVIKKRSPVFSSGVNTNETKEISLFNFLITGEDASNLIEIEDPKIRKSRIGGKIDYVEETIKRKTAQLTQYQDLDDSDIDRKIEAKYEELNLEYKTSIGKIDLLRNERSKYLSQQEKVESKILFNNELLDRFKLLNHHYESDIRRLEFISEGIFLVDQLADVNCPICGGTINDAHLHQSHFGVDDMNFEKSVTAELEKLRLKKDDLANTKSQIDNDNKKLKSQIEKIKLKIIQFDHQLQSSLLPVSETLKDRLKKISAIKVRLSAFTALKSEVQLLTDRLQQLYLEKNKREKAEDSTVDLKGKIGEFCNEVKRVLKDWNFPDVERIIFDSHSRVFDIMINDKKRSANGKGYRAITYSAFLYALMIYNIKKFDSHPALLIIDSPLTTFKDVEVNEAYDEYQESIDLANGVEDSFFSSLARAGKDKQIIIFENKIPCRDIRDQINYIEFTKDSSIGRYGFFINQ